MGWTCSPDGENIKCIQQIDEKIFGKRPLGKKNTVILIGTEWNWLSIATKGRFNYYRWNIFKLYYKNVN
jgi:hypothetical protein